MLSYLTQSILPAIQMAVHQCTRFSVNPIQSHELAGIRIIKYLIQDPDRGIIHHVDKSKCLEVYVDADFAGAWTQADADNADNVYSGT